MSKLGHGFKPAFDHVCGQRDRVIGFPLLIFFPRAETVFTPSARIPSQPAGAQQLRENPKLRLLCKPPFVRPDLLLHKILWSAILCVAVPLAVGVISALLTRNSMQTFDSINKPGLAPPGWLFPVVWTILYILMGIASYMIITSRKPNGSALITYGLQLIFNFFWSIIFFNLSLYLFAFIWLVMLWLMILKTTVKFYKISEPAGYLMIPYLLWVAFAG